VRSEKQPFGAEQVICADLELLLIGLVRAGEGAAAHVTSVIHSQSWQDTFTAVTDYLGRNLGRRLTIETICRDNLCGSSMLQKVFREKTGGGVMEYFGRMKIGRAKQEIREGKKNFTQIAGDLGYSSIHYFSRHFKKITGMTPSEYASSVKLLAEEEKQRPVLLDR
jgi:AraC-like DNA-binding protein